jgi:ribosomal-protein-alanine N-acetyltransferase
MDKTTHHTEIAQPIAAQPLARTVRRGWQRRLPTLSGRLVTIRELRQSDAPSLFALLTSDEVTRFMTPPPGSPEGFERFVSWARRQRAAGDGACFAVTLAGSDTAIGMFQVRRNESDPKVAEWGFAIGAPFWGSGAFRQGADLVMAFAFDVMRIHRLEARVAVQNGRGIAALRKTGAVQEAVLSQSLLRCGQYFDQALYTILRDDWRWPRSLQPAGASTVH